MPAMPPTRLHWPSDRSLFRRRARSGLGLSVAAVLVGLAVALVAVWPV
jgi:hypothetical protein